MVRHLTKIYYLYGPRYIIHIQSAIGTNYNNASKTNTDDSGLVGLPTSRWASHIASLRNILYITCGKRKRYFFTTLMRPNEVSNNKVLGY